MKPETKKLHSWCKYCTYYINLGGLEMCMADPHSNKMALNAMKRECEIAKEHMTKTQTS